MGNQDKQQKEKIKLADDSMERAVECVMQVDDGQVSGKCYRTSKRAKIKV